MAKFHDPERGLEGASLMWRCLFEIERGAEEHDVMHPLWKLVRGAELMDRPAEASTWQKIGHDVLTLAMARDKYPPGGGREGQHGRHHR